jgi:hypothetical protein
MSRVVCLLGCPWRVTAFTPTALDGGTIAYRCATCKAERSEPARAIYRAAPQRREAERKRRGGDAA